MAASGQPEHQTARRRLPPQTGWRLAATMMAGVLVACVRAHPPGEDHRPGELPSAHPDRIVSTWKKDPATSISVTWRTDPTVDEARAQITRATASPEFEKNPRTAEASSVPLDAPPTSENVPARYHSVTFDGLDPDTLYAYRVGHPGHWSEWLHARTAKDEPAPFSFIYLGDAQNDIHSRWSRAIRAAYARGTPEARFILHAGDLVNRGHRNPEWAEWHQAGGFIHGSLPTVAIPGNHEYIGGLSSHWRPQFEYPRHGPEGLEETVYYVDYQGMRLVALNSNEAIEKQAKWLDGVLSDNPNRWTVVTHHHPIYSSGEGRDNPELREHWEPLYRKHGVDLVLQGHDHTYARGRDRNLPAGPNVRDEATGTVYVNSVSGPKMYSLDEGRWKEYEAQMERAAENTQLFQIIHVDGSELRYRAYTAVGDLYDAFTLKKPDGPDQPNRFVDEAPDTPERTHENTGP